MSLEALIAENAKLREEIVQLRLENERLGVRNEELSKLVKELEARLAELEREQKRQAGPFRRRERLKVDPNQQKKRGRKPGHPGSYRKPPKDFDQTIVVTLDKYVLSVPAPRFCEDFEGSVFCWPAENGDFPKRCASEVQKSQ